MTYDRVFRNASPRGYKGRLCRIIKIPTPVKDTRGFLVRHIGAETVTVEFEGGEQLRCIRSAAVPVDSKQGRQTLAHVARGDITPWKLRQRMGTLTARGTGP